MKKTMMVMAMAVALAMSTMAGAFAAPPSDDDSTAVPGHRDKDSGTVMGRYDSVYAYDDEDYYWDLGDGRVYSSPDISGVDDLDQEKLTVCDYKVMYQGDFGGDPFLDTGWIRNNINCSGYDDNGTYNSLYIHESDPRYTGERESIWGTWEIMVNAVGGEGNLARPQQHVS